MINNNSDLISKLLSKEWLTFLASIKSSPEALILACKTFSLDNSEIEAVVQWRNSTEVDSYNVWWEKPTLGFNEYRTRISSIKNINEVVRESLNVDRYMRHPMVRQSKWFTHLSGLVGVVELNDISSNFGGMVPPNWKPDLRLKVGKINVFDYAYNLCHSLVVASSGVGKTTFAKSLSEQGVRVIDMDSLLAYFRFDNLKPGWYDKMLTHLQFDGILRSKFISLVNLVVDKNTIIVDIPRSLKAQDCNLYLVDPSLSESDWMTYAKQRLIRDVARVQHGRTGWLLATHPSTNRLLTRLALCRKYVVCTSSVLRSGQLSSILLTGDLNPLIVGKD